MPLTKKELEQLASAIQWMDGVNENGTRYVNRDGVQAILKTFQGPQIRVRVPMSSPTPSDLDQFDHED